MRTTLLTLFLLAFPPAGGPAPAQQEPQPYRYAYYLFEAPGKVVGCSDCYVPLLVTRAPLGQQGNAEAAFIHTHERDSIWHLAPKPVPIDAKAVDAKTRRIFFQGKKYRYQQVPVDEAVRLLENPEGTIPVHRKDPPVAQNAEPLRKELLRDLKAAKQ